MTLNLTLFVARYRDRARERAHQDQGLPSRPLIAAGASNRTSVDLADDEGVVSAVRLDTLTPLHRQRVVTPAGEPLALWLNEAGRTMTPAAWAAEFRRASARCCRAGLDLVVTPHALRHTFAVHMLSMLIHEQIGSVLAHGPTDDPGSAAYRRSISPARCVPCRTEEQTRAHRGTLITHLLAYPILLDRYGPYLTLGSFSCRPWRGRPTAQVAGGPRKAFSVENWTPRTTRSRYPAGYENGPLPACPHSRQGQHPCR